jgi:hypothetical protein
MFLQSKEQGVLVEVLDVKELIDPSTSEIQGRIQSGQEEQDPEAFAKEGLVFPSGEALPRCWLDADYQTKN